LGGKQLSIPFRIPVADRIKELRSSIPDFFQFLSGFQSTSFGRIFVGAWTLSIPFRIPDKKSADAETLPIIISFQFLSGFQGFQYTPAQQ